MTLCCFLSDDWVICKGSPNIISLSLMVIGWYEIYCGFNCFNCIHGGLIYCATESRSYLRYGFMIQHAHICPLNYPCMHFPPLFSFFSSFRLFPLLCTHLTFSLLFSCNSLTFSPLALWLNSASLSSLFLLFPSQLFPPSVIYSHLGQQEHKGAGLF